MTKKSFLALPTILPIICILSLVAVFFYNKNSATDVSAQEEEPAVCETEIPVGEAMEKTLALYNAIFSQFNTVYQAVNLQVSTTQSALQTAGSCDLGVCSSQCTPDVVFDPATGAVFPICIAQSCTGEPCNKEALSTALNNITNAVNSIQGAKVALDGLTDVDGAKLKEIRDLMKDSRRKFDSCIPTTRDIELQRGPTICGAALGNFWITDCKSLLNFFCCR